MSYQTLQAKIQQLIEGYGQGESAADFIAVLDGTAVNPTIPYGLTAIRPYAFYYMDELINPNLPNTITSIGRSAFEYCSELTLTTLPSGLVSIDQNAFKLCSKLHVSNLPDSITTIGQMAFYNCTSQYITSLPNSLTTIGDDAFSYTNCRFHEIPMGVQTIGASAFLMTGLAGSLTFLGTPTSISISAFNSCPNLTTINVPWYEGEVAGAPWGAVNATINYPAPPTPAGYTFTMKESADSQAENYKMYINGELVWNGGGNVYDDLMKTWTNVQTVAIEPIYGDDIYFYNSNGDVWTHTAGGSYIEITLTGDVTIIQVDK